MTERDKIREHLRGYDRHKLTGLGAQGALDLATDIASKHDRDALAEARELLKLSCYYGPGSADEWSARFEAVVGQPWRVAPVAGW